MNCADRMLAMAPGESPRLPERQYVSSKGIIFVVPSNCLHFRSIAYNEL
jgi:hypothetical protein